MTTLVTGASGFVGRALLTHLNDRRVAAIALVRRAGVSVPGAMRTVCVDTPWHSADFGIALAGVSVVVHLAARVHVMDDSASDPVAAFSRVNVDATLNLARQAAAAGVRRFVFLSSVKVHGELTTPDHPFSESDIPMPADPYGQSKHAAEVALRLLGAQTGMEIVIIRPPLIYGPGVKANFLALVSAVRKGWPLPFGLIRNRRSVLAVDNLTDFIRVCISHEQAANQTFLVSDADDVSTADLVRAIARAAGVRARLLPVPVPLLLSVASLAGKRAEAQRVCGNLQISSTLARERLGWTPPVDLHEGLRRVIASLSNA